MRWLGLSTKCLEWNNQQFDLCFTGTISQSQYYSWKWLSNTWWDQWLIWLVLPQAALLYFQIPLATMTGQLAIPKQTKNPESFLLYSYLGANMTVCVTPKLCGLMKLVISSKATTKFSDRELEKRFCWEDFMTGGFQRYLLNPLARFPWMQWYHPKKLHQSHTAISNVTCGGSNSILPWFSSWINW